MGARTHSVLGNVFKIRKITFNKRLMTDWNINILGNLVNQVVDCSKILVACFQHLIVRLTILGGLGRVLRCKKLVFDPSVNIDHFQIRRGLNYHEPCLTTVTPIEGPGCTRNGAKRTFILKTNQNI